MERTRHINTCYEKVDNLRTFIKQDLRNIGIKLPKTKKIKKLNNSRGSCPDGMLVASGIFGNYLAHVSCEYVTGCGYVPKFLVDASETIKAHVKTEGIFRKSGSVSRQKELKQHIEEGRSLDVSTIYDLTALIKQFFRELPEPLFTSLYHDTFIKCYQQAGTDAMSNTILDLCLLLPTEHLSTLRFIMQLFAFVASHSDENKMDATNLAVVLAPNIMHVNSKSEKMNSTEEKLLQMQTAIVELLIKRADDVGMVSEHLYQKSMLMAEYFGTGTDDELDASDDNTLEDSKDIKEKKKKRKRSGSFQGIVQTITSGLAKLRRSTDGKNLSASQNLTTASNESAQSFQGSLDQSQYPTTTPVVMRKRKASGEVIPFSASKKKAILQHLPQGSALGHTPFTPASTVKRMDMNGGRGVVDTPGMPATDKYHVPFTATPSHNIKTPRKKLNLFSPSSTKKKINRSPSFSNISNGSTKKTGRGRSIFRRLSGSKADKSSASDSSLHIGERLASPPNTRNCSADTSGMKRSQSESDSPIAALGQDSTFVPELDDVKQQLNEGFINESQLDLDSTDAGCSLQRSHSLYRPVQSSSDPLVNKGKNEGGNPHKRSHSAEIAYLKRGQPNTINNGLLRGNHNELRKLRKSFDKSDISAPIPVVVPPIGQVQGSAIRSASETSLMPDETHKGPPLPPPPDPHANSSVLNVVLAPPDGFNDTVHQAGYDSDESEAGFSTISGDTVIYRPKSSSSSASLQSNRSDPGRRHPGRMSAQSSQNSVKKSLQSSDSSDSLLSSASEMSVESTSKPTLERCLSTDSGKGSLFDETLSQPQVDTKESLDVAFVADESMLLETTVLQKTTNESFQPDVSSSRPTPSKMGQPGVKKSLSAQQLSNTPKIGVVRSHSMYCHQEARRHNIKPNLLISAETHKILSRAGYFPDNVSQRSGQDFKLSVKSPPRYHSLNLSRRNTSLADDSSVDSRSFHNEKRSSVHQSIAEISHGSSLREEVTDGNSTDSCVVLANTNVSEFHEAERLQQREKLLQIKRAEVLLPKHESVSQIQTQQSGKVAENVKQFTKAAENQLQFVPPQAPRQRGMSPVRIPTIFAKSGDVSARYREMAQNVIGKANDRKPSNENINSVEGGSLSDDVFKHPERIIGMDASTTSHHNSSSDVASRMSFEGQDVELSCSLLETINDICTPKNDRKNRSPLKDRGNNLNERSPQKIGDNVVLRTAGGMTPRHVLKFSQASKTNSGHSPTKTIH